MGIEDLHMIFLEVSCDLEILKKVLMNDPKAVRKKWDQLSDLACAQGVETDDFKAL